MCAIFTRPRDAIIPPIMTRLPSYYFIPARSTTIGSGRIVAEKWSVSEVKEI
jgi:hypothetical protein